MPLPCSYRKCLFFHITQYYKGNALTTLQFQYKKMFIINSQILVIYGHCCKNGIRWLTTWFWYTTDYEKYYTQYVQLSKLSSDVPWCRVLPNANPSSNEVTNRCEMVLTGILKFKLKELNKVTQHIAKPTLE